MYADNTFPKIIDIRIFIAEIETRILEALRKGSKLFPKIEMSEQFLLKHKGPKLKLVILFVDLVDSISMTRNFSVDKLATIIQIFTRKMSVIESCFK